MKTPDLITSAEKCAEIMRRSKRITVLTGAGISTSCGVPDFRGPKGLYITKKYDADTIFDIHYFRNDPKPFYDFARDFIKLEETLEPSFTHRFLAGLEKRTNFDGIITQNIDSLHHKAGSKKTVEIHGSFTDSRCLNCNQEFAFSYVKKLIFESDVPNCHLCGGLVKPDIVFFGEDVKNLQKAVEMAADSDLFMIVGSSCVVYPAAGLPRYASGEIIVVNLQEVKLPLMNVTMSVREDLDDFFKAVSECL